MFHNKTSYEQQRDSYRLTESTQKKCWAERTKAEILCQPVLKHESDKDDISSLKLWNSFVSFWELSCHEGGDFQTNLFKFITYSVLCVSYLDGKRDTVEKWSTVNM